MQIILTYIQAYRIRSKSIEPGYQYALNEWYKLSVAEVNHKLVEMGIRLLTNLVAGYDENGVRLEDGKSRAV